MRFLLQLSAALLLMGGQQTYDRQRPLPPQPPPPIKLTAKILSARYCRGSAASDILEMRLRLRYENTGAQKVILYQGNNIFYQTKIRSVVAAGAASPPYEVAILNARYLNYEPEKFSESGPGKEFVILSPGGSYETATTVGVGVVPPGATRPESAITEGEHNLFLVVSTWYESAKLAAELRTRWQRKGLLWYTPLTSLPVSFTVEKTRQSVKCP